MTTDTNANNPVIRVAIFLLVAVIAFFALNAYIYNKKQGGNDSNQNEALVAYFSERMTTLGVDDIGFPIEGFDANLLIVAFPGLVPADFEGVETLEGHYEVRVTGTNPNETDIRLVRDETKPVSSAERTISDKGFATLLDHVAARLAHPVADEASVDALIEKINTGEHVEMPLGESASALGVTILAHEIIEDSRCPIDVVCIQAGTVRVRTTLTSALGSGEQVFVLNGPITTEAEQVTLINVDPAPESTVSREDRDYVLYFYIEKR